MRKSVIVLVLAILGAGALFANGNAERITVLDGTLVVVPGADGGTALMLRTAAGDEIVIDMPQSEAVRMRLQEQTRLTVRGVYVPGGDAVQARILARVVNADGQASYTVENPVALTEQDRERVREWERDQDRLQTQTQTQAKTQTQAGAGASADGGARAGEKDGRK